MQRYNKQNLNRKITNVAVPAALKNRKKANLGMYFERAIIESNGLYKRRGEALVKKNPTDVKLKSDNTGSYGSRGTVDFDGIADGIALAFDAKVTRSETAFPLANIATHQAEYLTNFKKHGGVAFLLIHFELLHKTFYLSVDQLEYWLQHERKSIPIAFFKDYCELVEHDRLLQVDYLKAVKNYANGGNKNVPM